MSIPYTISLLALSATLAFAGGQDPKPAPSSDPSCESVKTDTEIEREIRDRFSKSKIASNNFEVRVQDGVAILEGCTDIVQHKGTATRLARSAGAHRVDNRIVISERGKKMASKKQRSRPRRVYVRRSESR